MHVFGRKHVCEFVCVSVRECACVLVGACGRVSEQPCVMDRDGWSGKFHLCSLVIKKLLQFQISL